jgi:hypothetical protein
VRLLVAERQGLETRAAKNYIPGRVVNRVPRQIVRSRLMVKSVGASLAEN